MTCRSEWHAPAPPTLLSTSPGSGSGTGTSRSSAGCYHSISWYAFISFSLQSPGDALSRLRDFSLRYPQQDLNPPAAASTRVRHHRGAAQAGMRRNGEA